MRAAWLAVALSFALAVAGLGAWSRALPDAEIRYAPRTTNAGRIFPGHALGQGFRCEFDRLRAIDVALASVGGAAVDLELALHVGEPDGPVLRRARVDAASLPQSDGWARFEFEPIADSAGVRFWFELASASPSSVGPWLRYRGVPYVVREWSSTVFDARVQAGELASVPPRKGRPDLLFADLRALAFAVDGLDGAAAPAKLALSDPATGEVLRRGELAPRAPIANGWAFFTFEPLHDTRYRALHYELELPQDARLIGNADGHSLVAYHSGGELDTAALGATCRGVKLPDRDLVFRAWSAGGARTILSRLAQRASWKLALGALAWLAAIAVAARAITPRKETP
jgi:hypothetical protein